jgi:hypothetical protein
MISRGDKATNLQTNEFFEWHLSTIVGSNYKCRGYRTEII